MLFHHLVSHSNGSLTDLRTWKFTSGTDTSAIELVNLSEISIGSSDIRLQFK